MQNMLPGCASHMPPPGASNQAAAPSQLQASRPQRPSPCHTDSQAQAPDDFPMCTAGGCGNPPAFPPMLCATDNTSDARIHVLPFVAIRVTPAMSSSECCAYCQAVFFITAQQIVCQVLSVSTVFLLDACPCTCCVCSQTVSIDHTAAPALAVSVHQPQPAGILPRVCPCTGYVSSESPQCYTFWY